MSQDDNTASIVGSVLAIAIVAIGKLFYSPLLEHIQSLSYKSSLFPVIAVGSLAIVVICKRNKKKAGGAMDNPSYETTACKWIVSTFQIDYVTIGDYFDYSVHHQVNWLWESRSPQLL